MHDGLDRDLEGRLIVFEGIDGSGKTTLSHALVSRLEQEGVRAQYLSFPGREPGTLGAEVYAMHHRRDDQGSGINPVSLQLLHVAAHLDAIENRILPLLRDGVHIVLDRFWWSTWVYGIVAGVSERSLKAMLDIETMSWGSIQPAVAFLVLRGCNGAKDASAAKRLTESYVRLARIESSSYTVVEIANDKTVCDAVEKVVKEVTCIIGLEFPRSSSVDEKATITHQRISKNKAAPEIFSRLSPAKTTLVYDTYWRFAAERQRIFFARIRGAKWPWTEDIVLRDYKFTNAYRASDRVSQFLIRNIVYAGDSDPGEIFFRTILFKIFNRIETWKLLLSEFGEITFREFSLPQYNRVLEKAMKRGERIYSAAYIMPSGGAKNPGGRKHSMHLRLLNQMMKDRLPEKIQESRSMGRAFDLIKAYPTIGDFLAYQYVTDLNYSGLTSFSEMEFVVPGPGALSGIQKCFSSLGGLAPAEIIKIVTERQEAEFERLEISFQSLWGRALQLIDCQNLFCEVDKYSRVKHPEYNGVGGRSRIKQRFSANRSAIEYWYPPKWGINEKIGRTEGA